MKRLLPVFFLCSMAALPIYAAETAFTFDQDKAGQPPVGLETNGATWKVMPSAQAASKPNILRPPEGVLTGGSQAELMVPKVTFIDGDVGVRFRVLQDNAPGILGLVWRYQNADNFYLAQIDLHSGDIGVLRMVNGKPKVIAQETTLFTPFAWHLFQVHASGREFQLYFDQSPFLTVKDTLLKKEGRVGLTASAGTPMELDDFIYRKNP